MHHWELDDIADQQLASLPNHVRRELATFMDAAVLVDPMQYQRAPGEPGKPLRTLYFVPDSRYGASGSLPRLPDECRCSLPS